eukprot:sb/3470964/
MWRFRIRRSEQELNREENRLLVKNATLILGSYSDQRTREQTITATGYVLRLPSPTSSTEDTTWHAFLIGSNALESFTVPYCPRSSPGNILSLLSRGTVKRILMRNRVPQEIQKTYALSNYPTNLRISTGDLEAPVGPRFTGTPIYREKNLPPIKEINGLSPRYTGHPDLPGKTLSPEHPGKSGSDCTYLTSRG